MVPSLKLGKLNIAIFLIALIALALCVCFGIRSGSADAASGGIGTPSPQPAPTSTATGPATASGPAAVRGTRFGNRTLREGMTGADVTVLKSIVRSKRLFRGAVTGNFDRPTTSAVRRFQSAANLATNGVVTPKTARKLVGSMKTAGASWYGPGLYGNGTACGKVTLRPNTIGVANKNLPCGTRVLFGYRGRFAVATVIDRGPYGPGRTWDLTKAVADELGFTSTGVGRVRHAIISRGK